MFESFDRLARSPAHEVALGCLQAGIEAAHPISVIEDAVTLQGEQLSIMDDVIDLTEFETIQIIGGGKAAATVAVALEGILGELIDGGIVVTDDPKGTVTIEVVQGDHPIPSNRGRNGAKQVLETARAADEKTLLLVTLSGGGSALLPQPADEIAMSDLQAVTEDLLKSGATIDEINAVRKHASAIKGGRLAQAAAPARVSGLVFSDVVGNDPSVIASGPLSPDDTTFERANQVLDQYEITPPQSISSHFDAGIDGTVEETPNHGDPVFDEVSIHILADGLTALKAAAEHAESEDYRSMILSSRIRGEAREAAKTQIAIGEEIQATGNPLQEPAVVVSGGETTVTVTGDGEGGPNQEFVLAGGMELSEEDIILAAVDTDGRDGGSNAAGAIVDSDTLTDPDSARAALDQNDAGGYLRNRDALLITGQTGTNVNDLRILVVG